MGFAGDMSVVSLDVSLLTVRHTRTPNWRRKETGPGPGFCHQKSFYIHTTPNSDVRELEAPQRAEVRGAQTARGYLMSLPPTFTLSQS